MHKPIPFTLSQVEMQLACQAGCMRRLIAIQKGCKDKTPFGQTQDYWSADIEGAAAELVVAKWLGKYWSGVASDAFQDLEGDVGKFQVRHTTRRDGSLIIRNRDKNEAIFILVVGVYPTYTITGWITGEDAKQERFLRGAPHPAYFVPQADLLDPGELEMIVKLREG